MRYTQYKNVLHPDVIIVQKSHTHHFSDDVPPVGVDDAELAALLRHLCDDVL